MNVPHKRGRWRTYAAGFRAHRVSLVLLTLAGLAQSFSWIPSASILRRIFDEILPSLSSRGGLGSFWRAVAEMMALQAAALVLAWWIRVRALRVSQDVLEALRAGAIGRFYRLPRIFHTHADTERLHLTLVYETNIIDLMNSAVTTQLLPGVCGSAVLLAILIHIEPAYALVLAIVAPALFALNRIMARDAWLRLERVRIAWENFSRGIRFMILALDLTRSHAAEDLEARRQLTNVRELRRISLELNGFDAAIQAIQSFLLLSCTLGALVAGGWLVESGMSSRGEVMVFYATAALFAVQVKAIVESIPPMRRGIESFGRLDELMQTAEREPYEGNVPVEQVQSVRMSDAWFHYRDGAPILRGAGFEIERGDTAALVGANGAGKTTVTHLLAGFYKPERGGLFVNGIPYEDVDIRSLRRRVVVLPQNPFLFPGTVRDNLIYGTESFSEEDIARALLWSTADSFVNELPEGLNTWIGEQGILLSGGQRQKLVVARAFLRKPDVLIFDEPTNHLDEETIDSLLCNVSLLPFRPAVLMISHAPVALRNASRIWRLEDGVLRETVRSPAC